MKTFTDKKILIAVAVLAAFIILLAIPRENEGTLDLGNRLAECKVHVKIEQESLDTYFKTFYCSHFANVTRCYSPRFDSGVCTKVYQYDREP